MEIAWFDLLGICTSPTHHGTSNPRAAATKKVFHLLEYMVGIGFGGLVPLEMWRFLLVKESSGRNSTWNSTFFLMLKCFVVDVEDSRLLIMQS